jgi:hypothetical protein
MSPASKMVTSQYHAMSFMHPSTLRLAVNVVGDKTAQGVRRESFGVEGVLDHRDDEPTDRS